MRECSLTITRRTHTGQFCFGRKPMQTFIESINTAKEHYIKIVLNQIIPTQRTLGVTLTQNKIPTFKTAICPL